MGARKFAVINVGRIGCAPIQRLQSPTGACDDGADALAAGFDDALGSLLSRLASDDDDHRLDGLTYSLGDLYQPDAGDHSRPVGGRVRRRGQRLLRRRPARGAERLRAAELDAVWRPPAPPLLGLRPSHAARRRAHRVGVLWWPRAVHHAGQLQAARPPGMSVNSSKTHTSVMIS